MIKALAVVLLRLAGVVLVVWGVCVLFTALVSGSVTVLAWATAGGMFIAGLVALEWSKRI